MPCPTTTSTRSRPGPRRCGRWLSAALIGLAVTVTLPDRSKAAGLFGAQEIPKTNISVFYKWTGVLDRFRQEISRGEGDCSSGLFSACHLKDWVAFVDSLRGKDLMTQIEEINRNLNRKRYIIDPRNWGMKDYWATPVQFSRKDGDCEDYAISKYMALRRLGISDDVLRIVVLQDLNLKIAHAVLVVYVDGQPLVLDNQIKQVVPAARIRHYKPYYSVNETRWWLYRG